ncbi:2-dehydro-3-deoxyglucarate aldolase [Advenella sp. S44]|uniref:aldolase/citrate lyase family protein n=1 Tax=Advenella sp. S44 TaxID=1982755 RepID=UPI000C2A91B5|nr:aldolase/citrate lyase family protein [Advenella sp. S44]PJX25926.1 2-dehydro-3-deoxyglucarate aldolase [Advenella sp. S44]
MKKQIPNTFRQRLLARETLAGMWLSTSSPMLAEVAGVCDYDWLLLDGEHAPNDIPLLMAQLQAINASTSAAIGRPPVNDQALIKQYLDIGFYNLLIPFVESGQQAEYAVAATRYPPAGVRGVAGMTRASAYGTEPDYFKRVNEHIGVIVQIESRAGVEAVQDIAAVEGVDAIFIGPSDLSAAYGYLGQPQHPEVQQAIAHVHQVASAAGKASGILAVVPEDAARYIDLGFSFVGVGVDLSVYKNALMSLRKRF